MVDERAFLESEIHELRDMLSTLPEDYFIERMGLEERLESRLALLEALPDSPVPVVAELTFDGAPVSGSSGMDAAFGGKLVALFSDAYAATVAGEGVGLRDTGRIPDRDKNQLTITGIATGSFGFQMQLNHPDQVDGPEISDSQQKALAKLIDLLRLSSEGTDDEVAEVVDDVHPRAVKAVSKFLESLVQHDAWCGLRFEGQSFRYANHDQIKSSFDRLKPDNIQEKQETLVGVFVGALPAARVFEFQVDGEPRPIKGKLGPSIEEPDVLVRTLLHRPVEATFDIVQVGKGKPRYTLTSLDNVELTQHRK